MTSSNSNRNLCAGKRILGGQSSHRNVILGKEKNRRLQQGLAAPQSTKLHCANPRKKDQAYRKKEKKKHGGEVQSPSPLT